MYIPIHLLSVSNVCDGFADCPDKSEEFNCKGLKRPRKDTIYCEDDFSFKCNTTKNCIYINSYCDSAVDSPDGSDESLDCQNNKYIRSVIYEKLNAGRIEFHRIVNGNSSNLNQFKISLLSK